MLLSYKIEINLIHALLLSFHPNMHLPRQIIEFFLSYSAVTKSNQPVSSPGPGDYVVKKPLPQTATVSKLSESRNLYKPFEPNPGPGAY